MKNRKIEYGVIPPEADAEFTAGLEEVLDTYAQPYAAAQPVCRQSDASICSGCSNRIHCFALR